MRVGKFTVTDDVGRRFVVTVEEEDVTKTDLGDDPRDRPTLRPLATCGPKKPSERFQDIHGGPPHSKQVESLLMLLDEIHGV